MSVLHRGNHTTGSQHCSTKQTWEKITCFPGPVQITKIRCYAYSWNWKGKQWLRLPLQTKPVSVLAVEIDLFAVGRKP